MYSFNRFAILGLVAAASLAGAPARAEMMTFKADLTGTGEIPPTTSPAKGMITVTYDTSDHKATWQGTITGLTGPATAAHFHGPAEPGKNAGVLVPAPGVTGGTFTGSATLTDAQAKSLMSGMTYFNIHTAANPNGEVRGQVTMAK